MVAVPLGFAGPLPIIKEHDRIGLINLIRPSSFKTMKPISYSHFDVSNKMQTDPGRKAYAQTNQMANGLGARPSSSAS